MKRSQGSSWVLGALAGLAVLVIVLALMPVPRDVGMPADAAMPQAVQEAPGPGDAAPPPMAEEVAQTPQSLPSPDVPAASEAAPAAVAGPGPQLVDAAPDQPQAKDGEMAEAPEDEAAPAAPVPSSDPVTAPAPDAVPEATPAPEHDPLLEPAPLTSVAPDSGGVPDTEATAPRAPQVAEDGGAGPEAPVKPAEPAQDAVPAQDSAPIAEPVVTPEEAAPLPSAGTIANQAPEVKTDGLPQIGKPRLDQEPAVAAESTGAAKGGLPQIGAEPPAVAEPVEPAMPLTSYARAFAPADPAKPMFVILLRDIGAAGMPRTELAGLPFPVTVVLDPLAPDAGEAMTAWRAAGQEVALAATGLPQGAQATDVAQTFQALQATLPEAVAVIDPLGQTFQNDRLLAAMVVPEIKAGGLGLVTWDEGLDAADQIAHRQGVPSVRIYRRLDAAGESGATIRRYLDRAVFKAAQDGKVVVLGDTRPETIAAILEWSVEGKAAGVNLAPLSAVLVP